MSTCEICGTPAAGLLRLIGGLHAYLCVAHINEWNKKVAPFPPRIEFVLLKAQLASVVCGSEAWLDKVLLLSEKAMMAEKDVLDFSKKWLAEAKAAQDAQE